MIIKFVVEGDFDNSIGADSFSLDLDARDNISNMKVHITLKYPNLDTD